MDTWKIILIGLLILIVIAVIFAFIFWFFSSNGKGACCTNGICTDGLLSSDCTSKGGSFQGSGSLCSNTICNGFTGFTGFTGLNPVGACCLAGGNTCQNTTLSGCLQQNGFFMGNGSNCSMPNICLNLIPTGSCCLIDGNCQMMTEQGCFNSNGIFSQGNLCPANCSTLSIIIKPTSDLVNSNTNIMVNILDNTNPNNVLVTFNASNLAQTIRQLPSNVNTNDYVRAIITQNGSPVMTNLLPISHINQCFRIGPYDPNMILLQTC